MREPYLSILIGAASLAIGYFISRYQNRELIDSARRFLRPFEAVSLRDEFHMTHILATSIRAHSYTPDLIVGIAPGGSTIAEWLSRRFLGDKTSPIPMCTIWMQVARDAQGRHLSIPAACPFAAPAPAGAKAILIVNDISRSGRTLDQATTSVKAALPNAAIRTAVLFLSQDAAPPYPDYYVDQPSRRVVFEWKERGV